MNRILIIILTAIICSCQPSDNPNPELDDKKIVTSFFDDGDRIYFNLPTINGDTIKAYTDTGGGWTIIYPWVIEKLGLKEFTKPDVDSNGEYILAKDVFADSEFHPFLNSSQSKLSNDSYFSIPSEDFLKSIKLDFQEEAFFGQYFFINHCWTFDYSNQRVLIDKNCNLDLEKPSTQKVGFKKDDNGNKLFAHPSINIHVEGEEIPVLFDTGATFQLSDSAQVVLNRKAQIGGSFIAISMYETWKNNHPEWNVIKGGDEISEGGDIYPFDMIEVPEVQLGDQLVGPVWFSARPDQAWSKGMIRSMDKIVKGALGGSALKYLSVTIDYPNELIEFEK